MDGYRNPELQRVLAALHSYSQQQQQNSPYHQQNVPQYPQHPNNALDNSVSLELNSIHSATAIPGLRVERQPNHVEKPLTPTFVDRQQSLTPNQSRIDSRMSTPAPPQDSIRSKTSTPKYDAPDASSITTWPAALKHVTRYLIPNEQFALRIKHMINEQHKHERQWWAGREAIVERQKGRPGKSQQVSAILKSLGAKDVTPAHEVTPSPDANQIKANEVELATYDAKVHKALVAMTADYDRQFREMGIPFYAIKHELVILKDGPEKIPGENKNKIDKGELRELQKRMCQTLEDLLGDEPETKE